jgi:hypothetical protein
MGMGVWVIGLFLTSYIGVGMRAASATGLVVRTMSAHLNLFGRVKEVASLSLHF